MKGLKTTTISILAVGLMAGAAVGVAAQDEEGDSPADSHKAAAVSGSSAYGIQTDPGQTVEGEGKTSLLGEARRATLSEMSDPRLNGTMRTVYNRDIHGLAGQLMSFSTRIDNEQGSWLGTGQGFWDTDDASWYFEAVYAGEGAYEGLSAVMQILATGRGEFSYNGLVFPGEMPQVPPVPVASARQ